MQIKILLEPFAACTCELLRIFFYHCIRRRAVYVTRDSDPGPLAGYKCGLHDKINYWRKHPCPRRHYRPAELLRFLLLHTHNSYYLLPIVLLGNFVVLPVQFRTCTKIIWMNISSFEAMQICNEEKRALLCMCFHHFSCVTW